MLRIKILAREEAPEASPRSLRRSARCSASCRTSGTGWPPALPAGPVGPALWARGAPHNVKIPNGIASTPSEAGGCNYCLAVHSYIARNLAKVDENKIAINREGRSVDSKRQAAIMFANPPIETAGKVSDEEFGAAPKAGCSDANIIDIIALTTQLLLTKFISNALRTPINFPAVPITKPKTA